MFNCPERIMNCSFSSSSALTTLLCAGLFALQTDDLRRGFHVTRGFSFYLVVIDVVLTIILSVMSLYDFMFSQRAGGDPTQVPDVSGARAITYDNPGYREGEHSK
jgi:hypothetical protein